MLDAELIKNKFMMESKGGVNKRLQARLKCRDQSQSARLILKEESFQGYIADINHNCLAFVKDTTGMAKIKPLVKIDLQIDFPDGAYSLRGFLMLPPRKLPDDKAVFVIKYDGDSSAGDVEKIHAFLESCFRLLES